MAYQAKWDQMLKDCRYGSITLSLANIPDYQDAFAGRTASELQETYMALNASAREKFVFIATRVLDTQTMMGVLKNTCFYAEAIYDIEAQAKALSAFQVTQAKQEAAQAKLEVEAMRNRLESMGSAAARLSDDATYWRKNAEETNEKYIALVDALRLVGFNPQV